MLFHKEAKGFLESRKDCVLGDGDLPSPNDDTKVHLMVQELKNTTDQSTFEYLLSLPSQFFCRVFFSLFFLKFLFLFFINKVFLFCYLCLFFHSVPNSINNFAFFNVFLYSISLVFLFRF